MDYCADVRQIDAIVQGFGRAITSFSIQRNP
jgi:hypothetical protein